MLVRIPNDVQRLWDAWNIRGLIILSLFLQSFLVLFAPLRKQRGGKWIIMIPLWIAYLLADWVATFTIGLTLSAAGSDILAFWAPFLLLHLGGPDTITSFSLEDNEFWIRHLLGLILQVGSTLYVIQHSLPDNKLWLPTFLVLIAGVIKYAERNRAFYLACFDQFGSNWVSQSDRTITKFELYRIPQSDRTTSAPPPSPKKLLHVYRSWSVANRPEPMPIRVAVACTVGAIQSLLVGPPMTKQEQEFVCVTAKRSPHATLRTIEIQLSLLYELLHTKLPVVDSKIGYICRMLNFGCILGALVSFSILRKKYYHNKLGDFDICLTYGLLIGALVLDLISIWLLMCSDWIIISRYPGREDNDEFIKRHRWSNLVPQLNIFDCHFKNKDDDPESLVDFLITSDLFETMRRRIHCVSLESFVDQEAWNFIFTTLRGKGIDRQITVHDRQFAWTLNMFEHMESLLIWHIATEICYGAVSPNNRPSSSTSTPNDCFDHRKVCKLISDYMFYLLVMEPTMTASAPNNLKMIFEARNGIWQWPIYHRDGPNGRHIKLSKEDFIKTLLDDELDEEMSCKYLLKGRGVDKLGGRDQTALARICRIGVARFLAKELCNQPGGCPWDSMGRFWVEIVCYAAIHCQPIVHARQVSRGGQLLTLVWLLINYLGLANLEFGRIIDQPQGM